MKLLTNKDEIDLRPAEVILQLDGPRRAICTSPLGGGIREDLTAAADADVFLADAIATVFLRC